MPITLDESGLIVAFEAEPIHKLSEAGLIVAFEAEPIHKFFEAGLIIITEEEVDGEPVLIQGEEMRMHRTLQGTELDPGPFFPGPD